MKSLRTFLPDVSDVKITIPQEKRSRALTSSCEVILNDGQPTQLEYKGDGAQSLTALSLMRFVSERSARNRHLLLAIEEPESHLHPSAIHKLRNVLGEISEVRQVVITSHCPLFVDRSVISNNIIVSKGKAAPASSVASIREVLGVRAADNLRNAELVLLCEGESDRLALASLLSASSQILQSALKQNTLAVDSLSGGSKLSYKLASLRDSLCNVYCFLDNDQEGTKSVKAAVSEGLISNRDVVLATCPGLRESELEDLYATSLYTRLLSNKYSVNLEAQRRRSKQKWTARMENLFTSQGRIWDDSVEKDLKLSIAKCAAENPKVAIDNSRNGAFKSLVRDLEARLAHER